MYRGDDRDFTITLTEDGSPIDLTGYSVVSTFRDDIDSDTATFQLMTADASIEIAADPTTGVITLHIPSTATADLERNITLLGDIELTDGSGNVRTAPEPSLDESTLIRLKIRADVTHE